MLRAILSDFKYYLKFSYFKDKWRKRNKMNKTRAGNIFPISNVFVDMYTYGVLNVRCYHLTDYKLKIGKFCSIGPRVYFMLCAEHPITRFSTYPFETFVFNELESGKISKGDIIVEDDVWIGEDCVIMSGVKIGKGSVIGAKSIVTKNVPSYSVYGGTSLIKRRFNDEICEKLDKINFNNLTKDLMNEYKKIIASDINDDFFNSDLYYKLIGEEK